MQSRGAYTFENRPEFIKKKKKKRKTVFVIFIADSTATFNLAQFKIKCYQCTQLFSFFSCFNIKFNSMPLRSFNVYWLFIRYVFVYIQ